MEWAWVGIIGAGRIGQVHLDTLASVPGVKPVIISDVVEPVLKMVTEKYGVPKYTLDVSWLEFDWTYLHRVGDGLRWLLLCCLWWYTSTRFCCPLQYRLLRRCW